jgi:phage-related protein
MGPGIGKRKVDWMGSSKDDLSKLPREPKEYLTYGIYLAETGKRHPKAKLFGGGIEEIVCDHDTNTYRAVYTLSLDGWVYVLHCFQKKSKQGIKTPKLDVDLIQRRLKDARALHVEKGRNKAPAK